MQYQTGETVQLGDRVQWDGRTCIVARIRGQQIGVHDPDLPQNGGTGSDLGGTLPTPTGYMMRSRDVRFVETGQPIPPPFHPTEIAHLEELLQQGVINYISFNGRVFSLTEVVTPTITELATGRLEQQQQVLRDTLLSLQMRYDRLINRPAEQNMPPVSRAATLSGIRVFINDNKINWLAPFSYVPQVSVRQGEYRAIPEHMREQLQQPNLLLRVILHTNNTVQAITLVSSIDFEVFRHYHCLGSHDCLGSFQPGTITSWQDLVSLRDRYQQLLTQVNHDSIANHEPPGSPTAAQLWDTGTRCENPTGTWTNYFWQIGRLWKVIAPPQNFPNECVGSIGKMMARTDSVVRLQFLFTDNHFMAVGGRNRTSFDFPISCVELCPETARRTRLWGIANRQAAGEPEPPEEPLQDGETEGEDIDNEEDYVEEE